VRLNLPGDLRRLRMQSSEAAQEEIEITLKVCLDEMDKEILSIFSSHPTRTYKVSQIKTILDYQNIVLSPQKIEKRLDFLVITTILGKRRGSRVYSYFLR
jgi:hypothetical protein